MERKERMKSILSFPSRILTSVETWPSYNIQTELGTSNTGQFSCAGCNERANVSRFLLYGQPYNIITIDPIQLDNRILLENVTFTHL